MNTSDADANAVDADPVSVFANQGFRLSPSAIDLLRTCPRKFYLSRLARMSEDNDSPWHFDYGNAVEAGVVSYLTHGSIDQAIVDAWLRYEDTDSDGSSDKKCLEGIVAGIQQFAASWPADEWKVHSTQLGFKLSFDEHLYYCGRIDATLVNSYTGGFASLECKTTGLNLSNVDPNYQNSEQAVAYPAVISYIAQDPTAQYSGLYSIFRTNKSWVPSVEIKSYPKSRALMLEWLMGLKLQYDTLKQYIELEYWPMYGHSCIKYNRPCYFFGVCHLDHKIQEREQKEPEKFDYEFSFMDMYEWLTRDTDDESLLDLDGDTGYEW